MLRATSRQGIGIFWYSWGTEKNLLMRTLNRPPRRQWITRKAAIDDEARQRL